jgi:hypothetical protein
VYALLCICLTLSALLALNALASALAGVAWRALAPRVRGWDASARARLLFALRVSPPAVAAALAFALVGLAGSLAMLGQGERAARLYGAAEALQARTGATLPNQAARALHERQVAALRAQLDPATFAAAWAEGRAMTLDEAIAYALEEPADG